MKRKIFIFLLLTGLITLTTSCSTSDEDGENSTSGSNSLVDGYFENGVEKLIFGVENPSDLDKNQIYITDGVSVEFWNNEGGNYSEIRPIGTVDNIFYYTIQIDTGTGSNVVELRKVTDGVVSGVSGNFVDPLLFGSLNNKLYFTATETLSGHERFTLYTIGSDGIVEEINLEALTGISDLNVMAIEFLNGILYFSTSDTNLDDAFYSYDGSTVTKIDDNFLRYSEFITFNGSLYFVCLEAVTNKLCKYDGSFITIIEYGNIVNPLRLIVYDNQIYFINQAFDEGGYLASWNENGLSTHGFQDRWASDLTVFDGNLYVNAYDTDDALYTLYRYNGTSATRVSASIYQTTGMRVTSNYLYFGAILEKGSIGFEELEQEMFSIAAGSTEPRQISSFNVIEPLATSATSSFIN